MNKNLIYDFENFLKSNQQEFFSVARIITKDRDLAIESTAQFFSEIYGLFEKKDIIDDKVELYRLFIQVIRNVLKKSDKGYLLYIVEEPDEKVLNKKIDNIYMNKEEFYSYILNASDKMGYIFREITALFDVALLTEKEIMSILEIDEKEFYYRVSKARENMIYNLKSKI